MVDQAGEVETVIVLVDLVDVKKKRARGVLRPGEGRPYING